MLRLLLKTITASLSYLAKGIEYIFDTAWLMALAPFRALAGNANMPPKFNPEVTGEDLLAGLQTKREQAVVNAVTKDGVATIYKYAKATPLQRSTIDLSALPAAVRATLLTMSDAELDVLSTAGQHEVRKFANGQEHNIFGLPKVDVNAEPMLEPEREVVAPGNAILLQMQTRIAREMKKNGGSLDFKMPLPGS